MQKRNKILISWISANQPQEPGPGLIINSGLPTLLNDVYLLYSCWCDMVLFKIRLRRWVQDSAHCLQILFCKGSLMSTATTVPTFMGANNMWAVKGKITFPSKSSVSLVEKIVSANPWLVKDRKNNAYAHFESGTDENKNFIKTK